MSRSSRTKLTLSVLATNTYFFLTSSISASPTPTTTPPPRLCEVVNIIESLIRIALGAGGLVTFVMIVFGSILWLTAGADDKKLAEAQSTITWGIIGLVLLLSSYFILVFIQSFTGVNLTQINFPWIGEDVVARPDYCTF